jgi:hypothetical protein
MNIDRVGILAWTTLLLIAVVMWSLIDNGTLRQGIGVVAAVNLGVIGTWLHDELEQE